jgi:hypothetical protein
MPPSDAATVQRDHFERIDDGLDGTTKGRFQCKAAGCGWSRSMSSASHAVNHILGGHKDIPKYECTIWD